MAESLGDALLTIRTDDGTFYTDVTRAKGASEQLGASMDKTKGSSAQLAGEMQQTARSADNLSEAMVRQRARGRENVTSLGAQRAGMQQLSYQLGDVATMYSLGARPMQIFASQSGQVIQAVQLMTGGTSKLAAFLGGPWGVAMTGATIVLVPLIAKLFEAEDAMEAVEFASDKMGEAQSILGSVIDLTTGKINRQSDALLLLAKRQALAGQIEARKRAAEYRDSLKDTASETRSVGVRTAGTGLPVGYGSAGGLRSDERPTQEALVVRDLLAGRISPETAIDRFDALQQRGVITPNRNLEVSSVIANLGVEELNEQQFRDLEAALNGDQEALQGFLRPQRGRGGGGGGRSNRRTGGRDQADRDADFADQSARLERELLQSRLSLATTAEERADIQNELLTLDRDTRIAEIEASDLSRERKDALIKQTEALLGVTPAIDEQGNLILSGNRGLEGQIIAREKATQVENEIAALNEARFRANQDALNLQLELADTEADRKKIALQLLDLEERYIRARLQAIIDAESSSPLEKQLAQIDLDSFLATASERRKAVELANATTVERYLIDLNKSPEQINEALDRIQIDGLDALEDSLVNVMRGVESLGDLFSNVADQIIADLLRIAIQQAIIKPLANSLFGGLFGGGSPIDLLAQSSLFAGGRALGGLIPTGQFGLVGEEGPELAFATPGGVEIFSNPQTREMMGSGGGTSVTIPISIDATGADPAALERLRAEMERMKRDLPGMIVTTVQDAGDRRIFSTSGWGR